MTKLNYWRIIDYPDGSKSLAGFIEKDAKKRFRDGQYIYTTPIQYRVKNKVITRSGTIYTLGLHNSLNGIDTKENFDFNLDN